VKRRAIDVQAKAKVNCIYSYSLFTYSTVALCLLHEASANCSRPDSNPMSISCVTDPRQCTIVVTRQFILERRRWGRELARPTGNERSCIASVECQQEISTEHRRHTGQKYHKRGHFQEVTFHCALLTGSFSRPNVYV
jgi:hypothetical protein